MPLNTDLNVSPYHDDFSPDTNYHRILFRPQVAVQARELNQVQSILQDQFEKFGDWAFRSGDIVSGCAISDVPVLPFIRLSDFTTNNGSYAVSSLLNTIAYSPTNGLSARVVYAKEGLTTNYPDTMTVYLQYLNTGNTAGPVANATVFSNTDTLTFQTITRDPTTNTTLVTNNYTIATYSNSANQSTAGQAHGITVTEGVVFINGNFVRVPDQTFGLVNNYGTYAGNNVVGFELVETIVTENQDESLLDNALGYPNENAPGAHRLKLSPTLVSYAANAISSNFNIVASYNYGALVTKTVAGKDLYSVIGSTIERRTYEESGNYILNPWTVDTVTNVGNSVIATLDSNNVIGRVSPGVAYAQGTRVELYNTNYVEMRRGVDLAESVQNQITFNYGGYFALNEVAGSFDFTSAANIYFYDTAQQTVTNRTYSGISTPTGNNIGSARMRCFSYNSGTPGTSSAQYLMHMFDIKMANGYSTDQVKSVYANNGLEDCVGDLVSTGLKNSQSKSQLYSFGVKGIKELRNLASNNNTEYTYRTVANKSMSVTGNVVVTLVGGNDKLPYGIGTLTDANASEFNLIVTSQGTTSALAGTISISSTNTYVSGTGTTFLSDFEIGSLITVGADFRRVMSVLNNLELNVDSPFPTTTTGAYTKTFMPGQILPISTNLTAGKQGSIYVSNTTSFTINTNQLLSSSINVDVVHNVLRTKPSATPKIINKDRFVKIDTTLNPKGPWCLGVADVSRLIKVYSSTSTYTTAGADVTRNFIFDTGQKDTHYDLGYLYPKPGYNTSTNPLLLVQLDFYTANTIGANSYGFFSVESYPVDDSTGANTQITVQTKDIPLYVNESGQKVPLRDVVDFRPFPINQAIDTGIVDTSNATQVTAAIALATVNPNNYLSFSNSSLYAPSYSKNFQADYVQYLPRKDLVLVTPNIRIGNNNIKVKEGLSGINPKTPLYPDNAMPLAVIEIPPYPSLSTDQRDELLAINQSSRSLIRDTSCATSITLVANRRYTMRDIGKLDQRISNLEYYTQLSLLEKKAVDMTVTDENGLDRFKNGIFVEPFSDYAHSEISDPEYNIAIDASKGVGRPKIVREVIPFNFNAINSSTTKTGRVVTLPYTEQSFLAQPYATKFRSAAPVAFAWNGTMFLIPSYDNHNDTTNTGSINITIDNTKSWSDFAAGPFGTIWGDWRTTTSSTNANRTSAPRTFNVNLGSVNGELRNLGPTNTSQENVWTALRAAGFSPDNFVLGTQTYTVGSPPRGSVPGWTLA